MLLKLYRTLSFIAGPFIDLYLIFRKKTGKEDPKRFSERLGKPGFPRPDGKLVWVHAASIGEVMSVLPLVEVLLEKYEVNVLITTGTVTSAKLMESRLPEKCIHQYVPIDKLITVQRFLDHWRPDIAFWVESELWPNLVIETEKTGCRMIQLNARISIPSYEKWQRYKSLGENMMSCFSLSLSQSEEDAERLTKIGAPNARFVGNLKFDAPALPADPKETGKLVSMIGERPIWVAASTHPGEEEIIAGIHRKLREKYDNILTIIIPRHPERGEEIKAVFSEENPALRSEGQEITEETQVYVADTIGELGIFYRLSGIVFVGGSLVEHGGQNPLEAARLECAIVSGPHTANFRRIYDEMESEQAFLRVSDGENLADTVLELFGDPEKQEQLANTALELIESKSGALENYLAELEQYLEILPVKQTSDEDS